VSASERRSSFAEPFSLRLVFVSSTAWNDAELEIELALAVVVRGTGQIYVDIGLPLTMALLTLSPGFSSFGVLC
jgi:hypothetical protein